MTSKVLIAMHDHIVRAYVGGVDPVVVFTPVKDEPIDVKRPQCRFTVPIPLQELRKNRLHDGWIIDVIYAVPVSTDRRVEELIDAYTNTVEHAKEIEGAFLQYFVLGSQCAWDGDTLNLEMGSMNPVFEPFVDEGTKNMAGTRVRYVIMDRVPRCALSATLFPSLA